MNHYRLNQVAILGWLDKIIHCELENNLLLLEHMIQIITQKNKHLDSNKLLDNMFNHIEIKLVILIVMVMKIQDHIIMKHIKVQYQMIQDIKFIIEILKIQMCLVHLMKQFIMVTIMLMRDILI